MKLLFVALLVLIATVGVTLTAVEDPGYVLIAYRDWTVETSIVLLVTAALLAYFALHTAWRLLVNTWHLPRRLHAWREKRHSLRARRSTHKGLIALAEGHWPQAEKSLIRYAELSETPLINYLGAARAAQKQGADERRDYYLSRAHHSMPDAELAVGLTQAEVQLSHGQTEQALATLMHLRTVAPKHTHLLYLLKRLYEQLESWGDLRELLPDLRRHKVLNAAQYDALEVKVHAKLLGIAAASGRLQTLREAWEEVPKTLHTQPILAETYAQRLNAMGAGPEAERILRDTLKRHFEPSLVKLYGLVSGEDPAKQLSTAEHWLKGNERNPELLLSLGRLSLRNQLWGKARSYLEASLAIAPGAEAYRELGALLSQLDEGEMAAQCFQQGLELVVGESRTEFKIEHHPAPA